MFSPFSLLFFSLSPKVRNAALVLAENPQSKVAQEHAALVKNTWSHRVEILRATVAGMTNADKVVSLIGELEDARARSGLPHVWSFI